MARQAVEALLGEARGNGNASAMIESSLTPQNGGTKVDIVTDLQLTGPVGQYGRGLVETSRRNWLGSSRTVSRSSWSRVRRKRRPVTQRRDRWVACGSPRRALVHIWPSVPPRLTVACRRSPRWSGERTENCTGQEELEVCREAARAVPAAVEELASPGTQRREDVFEVGGRARRRAQRGRIERSASQGEEGEARKAAAYLEAA
jgi:hypothetical protein